MFGAHPMLRTGGAVSYSVPYALRFRASNSAYLSRTFGSPTDAKKFTLSWWMKRGTVGTAVSILSAINVTSTFSMQFSTQTTNGDGDYFRVANPNAGTTYLYTDAVFRDPSAWYHFVFVFDSANATANDRAILYCNGTRLSTTVSVTLNATSRWNESGATARIGLGGAGFASVKDYFDGYKANFYMIDGQALTPSSFGQADATTGVWVPKAYSGTYGTNGFFLQFKDAASTTTIGYDTSGNSNNFTTSGISVTSGTTFDQMTDTPTNNYSTFDAISPVGSASSIGTLSAANLTFDHSAANYAQRFGSFAVANGKWYFEYTITTLSSGSGLAFGIGKTADYPSGTGVPGSWTGCVGYGEFGDSYLRPITEAAGLTNISGVASTDFLVNDIIMIAFDVGAGKFWMGKNGTWFDSGNPAAGTNEKQTFTANINWRPWCVTYGSSAAQNVVNFGQRAFSYTPPSGFKALNTANLPTPSIKKGSLYMDATLRTGTGATASVSSLGFQPDFVWIKSRSAATDHGLYDAVRGVQKQLESNTLTIETTETTGLTAFNSNGYTVGSLAQLNTNTATYVDWAWKEGVTPGFDIVPYAGNSVAGQTISHALGSTPAMMILRSRSAARTWAVYHKNLTSAAYYLGLETTNGQLVDNTMFNSTAPTSSVFSVGTYQNTSGENYIAYLWSEIEGFSKFGSYTGNASTDGPFVWCGFRPRYVLIKSTGVENWSVQDSARNPSNVVNARLKPNSADAEGVGSAQNVDFLSNGFKLRTTDPEKNSSSVTYIFAAFAENPFKYARAR